MRQWLYHDTEEARIFEGDEVLAALYDGWRDSPKRVKHPKANPPKAYVPPQDPTPPWKNEITTPTALREEERDQLRMQAIRCGVRIDRRWGVERLRAALGKTQ